jgi:hypothetical protein
LSSASRRRASSDRQARKAAWDESIAASSCSREQSGAWAKTAPVAGLITPKLCSALTALPSIVIVKSDMGASRWGSTAA